MRECGLRSRAVKALLLGLGLLFPPVFIPATVRAQQSQPADETESATRQYAVAVGFQNQKLYDSAIDEWQTFLKKFPNDPRKAKATHYLGICQLQTRQLEKAAATFDSVAKQFPKFELLEQTLLNHGSALYSIALKSKRNEEFAQAERQFAILIQQFPTSEFVGRALYYRGECLYQQKEYATAADVYSQLLKVDAKNELAPDACYALGICFEKLQKSEQAVEAFQRFRLSWPKHALMTEVNMRQAELLFVGGKFAEAKSLFSIVSKEAGFSLADTAMLREARCLYELNELNEAAKVYWNVARQFPKTKHYDASVVAGAKCYYLLGEYATCRNGLENILKRDVPEAADAAQWIARSLLKEKKPQEALAVLEAAITKHEKSPVFPQLMLTRIDALYEIPERRSQTAELYAKFASQYPKDEMAPQAQYMAALTALDGGDNEAARLQSDRFLRQFPQERVAADVQFINAEANLLLRDYDKASQRYQQFLKDAPKHTNAQQAQVRLALALQLDGKHAEASQQLSQSIPQLVDPSLKSEALAIAGQCYLANNQLESAGEAFEQSLKAMPAREQSDRTLMLLSDVYLRMNRPAEAKTALQSVIKDYPRSSGAEEATFRLGELAYAENDFPTAEVLYRRVAKEWPRGTFGPAAAYGLSWTLFKQDKFEDTVATLTTLMKANPKSDVALKGHYLKAMAEYQLGKHNDTISSVRTFLGSKPSRKETSDARYLLGLAFVAQKEFAKATREFEGILSADPDYSDSDKVLYELGWAWQELGKPEQSLEVFQSLAQSRPKSPLAAESLFRIAESLYDSEKFAEASRTYLETVSRAGKTELGEKAAHKLGWSALKTQSYAEAETAFRNQLASFPSGPLAGDAEFLIGECLFHQKQWRSAMEQYSSVTSKQNPTYQALALYRSGECAAAAELWSDSQKFHQQVLTQFEGFELRPEARYGAGWAMQQQGQLNEAIELYEQVTDETDTETAAKARFMIGECYFAMKKHDEAAKHFLKAAFAYGHEEWSAMAWFEAARCFEVQKDVAQAKNCYQQLIEKFPKHSKVADARKRLAEL